MRHANDDEEENRRELATAPVDFGGGMWVEMGIFLAENLFESVAMELKAFHEQLVLLFVFVEGTREVAELKTN